MSEYYEKYLKYKNKYLNLQSQIGGVDPVFVAFNSLGETTVVDAHPYQAVAYNIYSAIKEGRYPIDKRQDRMGNMRISNAIISPTNVYFEIINEENGYEYKFNIIDFNFDEVGMGNDSFCILVNNLKNEVVLSDNEPLLKSYAKEITRKTRLQAAEEKEQALTIELKQQEQNLRAFSVSMLNRLEVNSLNEIIKSLTAQIDNVKQQIYVLRYSKEIFVAYNKNGSYVVNSAHDYQRIAYHKFMDLMLIPYKPPIPDHLGRTKVVLREVTETINNMMITNQSMGTEVKFTIKKEHEDIPYTFVIKKFPDPNYPLFVKLVKEDKTELILSDNEQQLRGWVVQANRSIDPF
jgi:hypothetical protein